jgi:nucleolar protein 14
MPETPEALEKIVGHLSADDTTTALERIRKCHAPTLKEDNRKKMQGFLGLLLQRFETLAGMSPLPVDHLDVIAVNIAAVANIVPFFAVTSTRARLEKMSRRLTQRLRDGETGWPPARTILLISLFADVFPVTDKQHPVSTPAALYLGNVLAHCAVRCAREAVSAAVTSSLAARYSAPAGRVFPEAITLLSGLVHASAGGGDDWAVGLPAHAREQIGGPWLAPDLNRFEVNKKKKAAGKEVLDADADAIAPVSLASMLVLETEPSVADRDAALLIAVSTLRVLSAPALATAAAKEVLAPAAAAVNRLALALSGGPGESANEPGKGKKRAPPPPPPALVGHLASVAEVCVAMDREMREALAGRLMVPLRLREKKVEAIKTYNPMFEEQGYSKGRDYDPNRERAEKRKLRREVKKEKRGAVRELRKDNRFLAETVAREREAAADERGERQRETLSFLEKMESDLKSGGQGGMIVKNQRRVNGPPKRDRKKR